MLPVLDNDGMREADRWTIEDLGVHGLVLMENAATAVVDAIRERFDDARRALIICGPGNNGGDGLAVARHLANGGVDVEVVLTADPERFSPDATANFNLAHALRVPITQLGGSDLAVLDRALSEPRPDVIVDAILGTGIDRPLAGKLAALAARLSDSGIPVVAVDVPTGLNGSRSDVSGPVVTADLTVTFAALKRCHVLPPAATECGDVVVADIGIPPSILERGCNVWWPENQDIALLQPVRPVDAHKGRFGHLLVVAGAEGRAGAVAMAGRAAVVGGAGLITLAVPRPVLPVVDGACLEAMSHPLETTPEGTIAGPGGLEQLTTGKTAVAVGPGMGTGDGAAAVVEWLLDRWRGPIILDADAINLLAGRPEKLAGRDTVPVLTPHPGELARLLGVTTADVVADRLAAALTAASKAESIVVAKGFRTVIAQPDGQAWVNPTGDVRLASGGSGDVLTGLIGALLAQDIDPVRASIVGCWLHGRAGELGGERFPSAVPASHLPELIAAAWRELDP